MERSQLFDLMGELKLYGMKAAFDEIMTTAIKRQHEPQRIIGDLLNAEISEKKARSIKYQLTIAKRPLAKDLADFQFEGTPINQTLVNDLAGGGFIAQQRNAVLIGGTGTGKTHLAIAIARSCIRSGARGRFYDVIDLVNRLETETRNGRQGRLADHLTRMDFIILDELGYLPFAQSGGQLLFHLVSRLYERTSIIITTNLAFAGLLDRALLLLQFSAALRVSELVDLKVNDVARHSEGIVLTIKRSKTDQDAVGLEKAVPHGKRLRPVAALDAWLSAARITEGPLFRTVRAGKAGKVSISVRTVSRMIKRRCAAVGLDPAPFASHSLRSGFITSAATEGARSPTMGYVQTTNAFRDHAGKKIL